MPNYKCKFQNEWLNEYKWLQKVVGDDSKAKCKMCQSIFSIASHGHGALLQHKKSVKHNEAENAAAKSTSVDQMFKRSPESDKLAAMEATYVYHIIKEGQSFASTKCTANLFRTVFRTILINGRFGWNLWLLHLNGLNCVKFRNGRMVSSRSKVL